jgi:hypothetical protein
VRRLVAAGALALCLAGCGGKAKPDQATLTAVEVRPRSVAFVFDSPPQTITHRYVPIRSIAECGSGRPLRPQGAAALVVIFMPALTEPVPKRFIMAAGPVREVARVCAFEAEVGWAIGLDRRLPLHVSRDGSTVTVSFGRP